MRRAVPLRFYSVCVGLAFATVMSTARAQNDPVAARTLFDDGRKLLADGKYDMACPKFEESQKLDPGMGTLFNLADCWEHIGRTASAWARFREVADAARRAGQQDREKIARARAEAAEPKLSRLLVEVKAERGTELTKDGVPFSAALWGSALPIDPGTHTIEAKAPSKQPWKATLEVPAKGTTVSVVVPALENESVPAAAPPVQSAISPTSGDMNRSASSDKSAQEANGSERSSGTKVAGWLLEGVGVAGVAIGTVFAVKVGSKNTEADSICPPGSKVCSAEDHGRFDTAIADAKSARTLSIIGFASGGAALVGGTILLLTGPKKSTGGFRLGPAVGSSTVGATFAGMW